MTQVVIVGAGPAGATLALLLVKRGIRVTLIEASRNFRRIFRGEGLMPSGLDALAQMELLPILERIPHQPLDAWEIIINKRSLFRVDEPIEPGGKPCTLVSQPALLEALIDAASRYSHFEFIQATAVQDLLWNQRVSGVKLSDGRHLDADLTIGTDGRNSIVRQRANLALEQQSHSFDILWFKLADSPRFASENIFYSIVCDRYAFGLFRGSEGDLHLGWTLPKDFPQDWKLVDNWAEIFACASPAWLAEHFRESAATIEQPVLLSVVVGQCPRWYQPGVLLLGDAAHPMSPIRAQGINMALRDAIAAANYLVPCLSQGDTAEIDAVLPRIQSQREPEIIKAQRLQSQEAAQAELLENSAILRWGASVFAPLIRLPVKLSWLHRQRELRQGVTPIKLTV
ncbi:FAD-dependent monooxygenase [Chroogloeocystis siderophila]|jgi:2-polyprenyl-6-methoxyphenol hydroxylase-like FAD-dependent oxidoreductase|uniref:Monooxygenase n=1 Tax=Chroogloeocystis siderophila 5.2 s.c.1 TaxID=247279 RepID=A0A1U7HX27_9CHRO|nr:FAD-dependent monooxygenase [Chroogloeocystis siderophila]OKH28101.1 monooxygenase [Chroogloeocystis siderophila 5.2 s.c.1]